MNVKSPDNTSKWQMGFNSAFKGLMIYEEGDMMPQTVCICGVISYRL